MAILSKRTGPSGYVPFPPDLVLRGRTGQQSVSTELLSLEGALPLSQAHTPATDPALRSALVGVLGRREEGRSMTSYGTVLVIEPAAVATFVNPPSDPLSLPTFVLHAVRIAHAATHATGASRFTRKTRSAMPAITPAEELRSLTGLAPGRLADLFSVSRTTFYKWMEGATPRDERFQHLVDMLAHVKDARRRLPSSVDIAAWLRTPISPGAKTPLEYLRDLRFNVFRGLVLRQASVGLAPTVTSVLPSRQMTRIERAIAHERIAPHPRVEDDEKG